MARSPSSPTSRMSWSTTFLLLVSFLSFVGFTTPKDTQYVQATTSSGENIALRDDRKPALYTQNFGDCLGESLITVTRFDAAYYKDNMTVLFHLEGNTHVANESIMMYIGVFAYGESRFDLTFNPCSAQIYSLCPMNRSVPIEANGIIPVSQSDVANIPPIALSIPDFEGQAILRIFGNSTQTEIGCYSAVVTNGGTFSQPKSVGTVLGIFTSIAVAASLATAIYGNHVPTMRTHYAHSLSIFVVFAVFHHIFYTGALSMNWPSVLAAWWSNFAWSAGMIYSESMQNSVNQFLGSNKGNTSSVGAASTGASADNIGGGYQLSQIYKRSSLDLFKRSIWEETAHSLRTREIEKQIAKRALANSTEGYSWYGKPVKPGLPIPGNYSGFAGTLSVEGIPASNAFMTGFLWLLILVVLIAVLIASIKWTIEGLSRINLVKTERLTYFRSHWVSFLRQALLRACFIDFFMMIFLTLFQFSYKASAGPTAVGAIVFALFFVGMSVTVGYACFCRLRLGHFEAAPDRLHIVKRKAIGPVPWYGAERESERSEKTEVNISAGSLPWLRIHYIDHDMNRASIHEDEEYIKQFGWLASRFRRTRWWSFALWLGYEFIRACFYGGAAGQPMSQVFGLLVVEIIAFAVVVYLKPFEGARLNALMVYLLGISKILTVALSAAFDVRFNIPRINATVIGVVIIVIQGVLTISLMIAIVVGAISSYMSITRNQEDFRPRKWESYRQRYFAHIQKKAADLPLTPPPPPEEPKGPYFNVTSVRRNPKIEDEDDDIVRNINDPLGSRITVAGLPSRPRTARPSRTNSIHDQLDSAPTGSVPFGARVHRTSWSTRDFRDFQESSNRSSRIDHSTRNSRIWSTSDIRPMTSDSSLREAVREVGQRKAKMPLQGEGGGLDIKKSRHGKEREEVLDERRSEEQIGSKQDARL
ncbi:hypothetical protein ACLMJK_000993 [Lecanora helva]